MEEKSAFGYDLNFLQKYQPVVVLTSPDDPHSKAIVIPGYQGRVMTSTAGGNAGNSYGWINYDLIGRGVYQPHINAYGGEERFWLAPEGGQFSVYFKKGQTFDFENWQTPALIDTLAFEVVEEDLSSVSFRSNSTIENHSGTSFHIEINRKVSMLSKQEILSGLGVSSLGNCKSIGYKSVNSITNKGKAWKTETGTLGIWLLGMFRPSEKTVIIVPFSTRESEKLLLTDHYFGKIPADRLVIKDSVVLMKADGKFRSKMGLAPLSAKNVMGSYDSEKEILTIIKYSLHPKGDYLKSTWEIHKEPYKGDAINAYNDGKLADGKQMGPFYELESSSETRVLQENETLTHTQSTYHFEGDRKILNIIAKQMLDVELDSIKEIF